MGKQTKLIKKEKKKTINCIRSEDPGSPILKNILNGSSILRTTVQDKNVLLTPQKANFVSSLYGGLKKNDEKQMRHKVGYDKIDYCNQLTYYYSLTITTIIVHIVVTM